MTHSGTVTGLFILARAIATKLAINWPAAMCAACVSHLRAMATAMRTRRMLARLDDRMLSDIGISRADALEEAGRVPWDVTSCRKMPR